MIAELALRFVDGTWDVLAESAPYLLFGCLVAGLIHGFLPTEAVARHLGSGRLSSVVKAALVGIPLPLCSCGVIPAALNLRKKGASRGAVVSFLISTPETGVDSIALSWVLLGPVMTLFRPLAAFVTAVAAGVLENFITGPEAPATQASSCGCCSAEHSQDQSFREKLREGLRFAFGDLLKDLAPWLGAGFAVAGLITAAVPDGFVGRYLGPGPLSYLAMLALGVPLYICATASTPIAAALLLKGLSPGAALVFLLAGPATNATTITALSGTLGGRTTARYVLAISAVSVGMGALLDTLYAGPALATLRYAGAGGEVLPASLNAACAVVLVALCLGAFLPGRGSGGCSGTA